MGYEGDKPTGEMRRGSADSIRACGRRGPHQRPDTKLQSARLSAYDNHVLWATILGIALIARVAWRVRGGFKRNPNQHVALRILARAVMIGFLISIVAARLLAVAAPTRLPTARPSPSPQTLRLGVRPHAQSEKFSIDKSGNFSVAIDTASAPSFAGRAETPDHRPRRRIRRNLPALGRPGLDETLDSSSDGLGGAVSHRQLSRRGGKSRA